MKLRLLVTMLWFRMLMTCLKYLSTCPCPRCLLPKLKISRIGSKSDTQDRLKLVRFDSENRRNAVDSARRLLFNNGVNVTSTRIKDILDEDSLTPTRVCVIFLFNLFWLISCRMPFLSASSVMASIFIRCSLWISSTSLNLVFGKPFSHTFSESYMLMVMERFKNLTNGMTQWNLVQVIISY